MIQLFQNDIHQKECKINRLKKRIKKGAKPEFIKQLSHEIVFARNCTIGFEKEVFNIQQKLHQGGYDETEDMV